MNLYAAASLIGFGFGLLAAACIVWAVGDGSARIDAALAELDHDDDDVMAVADAVQSDIDEPIGYAPVLVTTDEDREWLGRMGVQL